MHQIYSSTEHVRTIQDGSWEYMVCSVNSDPFDKTKSFQTCSGTSIERDGSKRRGLFGFANG